MTNKIQIKIIGCLLLICASILCACSNDVSHTHQYGEWTVTKAATCVEEGEEARQCSCGMTQTRAISLKEHSWGEWVVMKEATCAQVGEQCKVCSVCNKQEKAMQTKEHSYGEWIVTKEATCANAGNKYRTCSVCNHKETASIPKLSTHNWDDGSITKAPTCTDSGTKLFTCTVCNSTKNETLSPLGHSTDKDGKCSRCGLVTLNMTSIEIAQALTVKTMSYSAVEYSDEICINIQLKDKNSYTVQVPACVKIMIVDDNENVLYSETLIKKASQDKVTIDYEKITNATSTTGTLYYYVYNDYFIFDLVSKELVKIPWTVPIELPDLPQTISYTGYSASSCKITEITYKVSDDDVTFYFTGEKTYDKNGSSHSSECIIAWKLYDQDGYVIYDGTCYSQSVSVGEKFKNADSTAYNVIEQGKTYRLVILDVS